MVRLVPTPHRVRSGVVLILPLLHRGTEIELMGPAVPGLLMRKPISLGDGRRFRQAVGWDFAGLDSFRGFHAQMDSFAVHAGVDQEMHDMDISWPKFARHRLRHPAKREFC